MNLEGDIIKQCTKLWGCDSRGETGGFKVNLGCWWDSLMEITYTYINRLSNCKETPLCVFMLPPLAPESISIDTFRCKGWTITVQINANDNLRSLNAVLARSWSYNYKSMRAKYSFLHGNERFAVFLLGRPFVCYTDFILFLSFSILKRIRRTKHFYSRFFVSIRDL